ncbi:cytochrome c oxidase subunit II [Sphingomonas sp.]|uniref:cytochrome c oxidase subunit II n=1 Tax=Sphingomonas sp. TaxID=28214 RepID=UPI00286C6339|nr:cytochrome c oxidase subunit II [Sphingomonas sp.]
MKLIGWAIALAAAGLTPAAAQVPPAAAPTTAVATATPMAPAVVDHSAPAMPAGMVMPVTPPAPGIGVPDGRMGIQFQVTDLGREAQAFHDGPLLWLCAVISAFVLGLLAFVMFKFRRGAHPTPSRNSHNTLLEIVWTLVPVLILVGIAIPSIQLLRHQYSPPKADLTVKVIGNQWYWTYQYPDNGDLEIVSNMLKEKGDVKAGDRFRTDADGPPLLAVDERMVIPAGKVVKFIVTSNDVIHSFGVPALWQKMDANPGQLNETWAKVDRPGVYFGQCSELCGARHGYMPIVIEAVTPAKFAAWIASKGGKMPGAAMPKPDATASADPAAIKQPVTNQAATAQN